VKQTVIQKLSKVKLEDLVVLLCWNWT